MLKDDLNLTNEQRQAFKSLIRRSTFCLSGILFFAETMWKVLIIITLGHADSITLGRLLMIMMGNFVLIFVIAKWLLKPLITSKTRNFRLVLSADKNRFKPEIWRWFFTIAGAQLIFTIIGMVVFSPVASLIALIFVIYAATNQVIYRLIKSGMANLEQNPITKLS